MYSNGFRDRQSKVIVSMSLLLLSQTFLVDAIANPDADLGTAKDASSTSGSSASSSTNPAKDAGSAGDSGSSKDSNADSIFSGNKSWAIVPAGSTPSTPRPSVRRENQERQRYQGTVQTTQLNGMQGGFRPSSAASFGSAGSITKSNSNANSSQASTTQSPPPMKLFGRIEELCAGTGAKIPLKMQAMTPIRDTSLDVKPVKLASNAKMTNLIGKTGTNLKPMDMTPSTLTASVQRQEPAFPIDYRGTFSGELTVQLVNFDPEYFKFDQHEAEKQQKIITQGKRGKCSVTFYEDSAGKIDIKPTQVTFMTTANAAEEIKDMGNSPLTALFGGANAADNPILANMQIPIPVALPLGFFSAATGVTGNQLASELMKSKMRELAKGVLETQVVTKDSDKNTQGQVKTTFTENVLRFTRVTNDRLYLQAAAVSYDNEGKYLNKVVLSGTLDRGADSGSTDNMNALGGAANPLTIDLNSLTGGGANPLGGAGGGSGASPFGGGGSNPFGGGGSSPFGGGGSSPFGGGGASPFGGGGGQGGNPQAGIQNMVEQMQQVQKMLKEMDGGNQ